MRRLRSHVVQHWMYHGMGIGVLVMLAAFVWATYDSRLPFELEPHLTQPLTGAQEMLIMVGIAILSYALGAEHCRTNRKKSLRWSATRWALAGLVVVITATGMAHEPWFMTLLQRHLLKTGLALAQYLPGLLAHIIVLLTPPFLMLVAMCLMRFLFGLVTQERFLAAVFVLSLFYEREAWALRPYKGH